MGPVMSILSNFSKVHVDDFNTASTGVKGILNYDLVEYEVISPEITEGTISVITDTQGCLWGSGSKSWFKVCNFENLNKWSLIDYVHKPVELVANDEFYGIYSFFVEDKYYSYIDNQIVAIGNSEVLDWKNSKIEMLYRIELPDS